MHQLDLNRREFNRKMKRRRIMTCVVALILMISIIGAIVYSRTKSRVSYLYNLGKGRYEIEKLRDVRKEYEKGLNIENIDYPWGEGIELGNKPQHLIWHHAAATNLSPEKVHQMHLDNGWVGIGYHFYITKDGKINRGRKEEMMGAHAKGKNSSSLGICLEGNFENEELTYEQEKALIKLSADLVIKYNIKDIEGHRDVYNTLCPGKNFNTEYLKEEVAKELINLEKK